MTEQNYPKLPDRIKATVADMLVLLVLMASTTYLFAAFENVPDSARMVAFVFVFGLYDPLFTSIFGGTIGHMIVGIRVKRQANQERNILFPKAVIRFIVKVMLGWISLLTVTGNNERKAIHDFAANSLVVYKNR